jgi:hypothetical protein
MIRRPGSAHSVLIRHGPDDNVMVHVDVYEPAEAFAGTLTLKVGVTVWLPVPVFTAALKSFVAAGALVPAGSV